MAQDEFKDVNLTVKIDNFKGRKRCPYCGKTPNEMEWSSQGLRIWCKNPECNGAHYHIFVPIPLEETNLQFMTWDLIREWNKYCLGIRKQRRMKVKAS